MRSRHCAIVLLLPLLAAACDDDTSSPTPAIYANPGNVVFSAEAGGANPAPQTVNVLNTGGGSLTGLNATVNYEAGQPTGWLTATLNENAAPATLTLTPTLGSLQDGSYAATVALAASGGARNTPHAMTVVLNVAESMFSCVPSGAQRLCTFRYRPPAGAPALNAIAVPGMFNGWNPGDAPMTEQNGVWSRSYTLDSGEYEYKFHINGEWIGNMCNDGTWGHGTNRWVHTGAAGCKGDNAYIVVP
jgi:hypothetical protein